MASATKGKRGVPSSSVRNKKLVSRCPSMEKDISVLRYDIKREEEHYALRNLYIQAEMMYKERMGLKIGRKSQSAEDITRSMTEGESGTPSTPEGTVGDVSIKSKRARTKTEPSKPQRKPSFRVSQKYMNSSFALSSNEEVPLAESRMTTAPRKNFGSFNVLEANILKNLNNRRSADDISVGEIQPLPKKTIRNKYKNNIENIYKKRSSSQAKSYKSNEGKKSVLKEKDNKFSKEKSRDKSGNGSKKWKTDEKFGKKFTADKISRFESSQPRWSRTSQLHSGSSAMTEKVLRTTKFDGKSSSNFEQKMADEAVVNEISLDTEQKNSNQSNEEETSMEDIWTNESGEVDPNAEDWESGDMGMESYNQLKKLVNDEVERLKKSVPEPKDVTSGEKKEGKPGRKIIKPEPPVKKIISIKENRKEPAKLDVDQYKGIPKESRKDELKSILLAQSFDPEKKDRKNTKNSNVEKVENTVITKTETEEKKETIDDKERPKKINTPEKKPVRDWNFVKRMEAALETFKTKFSDSESDLQESDPSLQSRPKVPNRKLKKSEDAKSEDSKSLDSNKIKERRENKIRSEVLHKRKSRVSSLERKSTIDPNKMVFKLFQQPVWNFKTRRWVEGKVDKTGDDALTDISEGSGDIEQKSSATTAKSDESEKSDKPFVFSYLNSSDFTGGDVAQSIIERMQDHKQIIQQDINRIEKKIAETLGIKKSNEINQKEKDLKKMNTKLDEAIKYVKNVPIDVIMRDAYTEMSIQKIPISKAREQKSQLMEYMEKAFPSKDNTLEVQFRRSLKSQMSSNGLIEIQNLVSRQDEKEKVVKRMSDSDIERDKEEEAFKVKENKYRDLRSYQNHIKEGCIKNEENRELHRLSDFQSREEQKRNLLNRNNSWKSDVFRDSSDNSDSKEKCAKKQSSIDYVELEKALKESILNGTTREFAAKFREMLLRDQDLFSQLKAASPKDLPNFIVVQHAKEKYREKIKSEYRQVPIVEYKTKILEEKEKKRLNRDNFFSEVGELTKIQDNSDNSFDASQYIRQRSSGNNPKSTPPPDSQATPPNKDSTDLSQSNDEKIQSSLFDQTKNLNETSDENKNIGNNSQDATTKLEEEESAVKKTTSKEFVREEDKTAPDRPGRPSLTPSEQMPLQRLLSVEEYRYRMGDPSYPIRKNTDVPLYNYNRRLSLQEEAERREKELRELLESHERSLKNEVMEMENMIETRRRTQRSMSLPVNTVRRQSLIIDHNKGEENEESQTVLGHASKQMGKKSSGKNYPVLGRFETEKQPGYSKIQDKNKKAMQTKSLKEKQAKEEYERQLAAKASELKDMDCQTDSTDNDDIDDMRDLYLLEEEEDEAKSGK